MTRFACVPTEFWLVFALIHRQQSCLICAPSEPLLCAVAHDSSRERCIGSRCRSRVRAAAPSVSMLANKTSPVGMRAVPARASQATFEERWTLGRGLQVRSVAGPSSVCVRARALSGGSGGGPQCLVRVHCLRSWRTSCASTPSSSSASHSLRRPFKRPRRSAVARHWPVRGPLAAKPNCR